jgi:hypothetical protein
VNPPPIEPFQERLKLGGAQPHHAIPYRRPSELTLPPGVPSLRS